MHITVRIAVDDNLFKGTHCSRFVYVHVSGARHPSTGHDELELELELQLGFLLKREQNNQQLQGETMTNDKAILSTQ